ncbi:hypothetical protein K1T71_014714 [Dendrolimus kikuchii]|nr:hypothetical protein K1T71_014714 [Dendrolimus kikuchii]
MVKTRSRGNSIERKRATTVVQETCHRPCTPPLAPVMSTGSASPVESIIDRTAGSPVAQWAYKSLAGSPHPAALSPPPVAASPSFAAKRQLPCDSMSHSAAVAAPIMMSDQQLLLQYARIVEDLLEEVRSPEPSKSCTALAATTQPVAALAELPATTAPSASKSSAA